MITAFWDSWLMPRFVADKSPTAKLSLNEILNAPEVHKFAPTIRDARALGLLFGARILTTTQLGRVLWPGKVSSELARRRLGVFYKFGLVARLRPVAAPGTGSMPYLWTVTAKGLELFMRSGLPEVERLKPRHFEAESYLLPSQLTVLHSLIAAELGTQCLAAGGDWYFEKEADAVLKVRHPKKPDGDIQYPDAVLVWPRENGSSETWYIEVERSARTESFLQKMDFWRRLRAKLAAENKLEGKHIVVVGRTKDRPDRSERSILPLARLSSVDTELKDFIQYIAIKDEIRSDISLAPVSGATLIAQYAPGDIGGVG